MEAPQSNSTASRQHLYKDPLSVPNLNLAFVNLYALLLVKPFSMSAAPIASTSAIRHDFFEMNTLGPRQRANVQPSASTSVRSGAEAAVIEDGPVKRATKEWFDIQQELPPQITKRCVMFFEKDYLEATENARAFS